MKTCENPTISSNASRVTTWPPRDRNHAWIILGAAVASGRGSALLWPRWKGISRMPQPVTPVTTFGSEARDQTCSHLSMVYWVYWMLWTSRSYIYIIIIYKIMYMDCSEPTSKLCVRTNARTYEWNLPCRSIVPMAAMAPGNAPRPRIRRQDKPLTFIMVLVLVTPSPQVAKKRWTLSWLYHCRVSSVF